MRNIYQHQKSVTAMAAASFDLRQSLVSGARRIVCLLSTPVVTEEDGCVALDRLASAVKQLCALKRAGHEIIVVASGAVGIGQEFLRKQAVLSASLDTITDGFKKQDNDLGLRVCAAAGQAGLMSLLSTMFGQYEEPCAQILTEEADFADPVQRSNFAQATQALLKVGVIPVINENDVMSRRGTQLRDSEGQVLWDNEPLAMLIGRECFVDVVLLVGDTPGLLSETGDVVDTFDDGIAVIDGGRGSRVGLEGVRGKVSAAQQAVRDGWVRAVLMIGVNDIESASAGEVKGTLFARHSGDEPGTSRARL